MNILLVTCDQFRGDCLSAAGHPVVKTPNLDSLAASGTRLARHYSQAAPCAPGRACLYTGTYQLTNRVVTNGTPLDDRFDNVARAARRAGYVPTLFGYTDTALDPRPLADDDPRLRTYQGILPGFEDGVELLDDHGAWRAWLEEAGYDPKKSGRAAAGSEAERPAEFGVSAFLTNCFIDWLERRDQPWFAHVSYYRPHPPYAAAGEWSRRYALDDVGPAAPKVDNPFVGRWMAAPSSEFDRRGLAAQYYGMVSDVDAQLGRVWDALVRLGMWDDTFIVVTSDHGEQLGDQGLLGKGGFFEASYHVPGIVRDPRFPGGVTVDAFTENVDIMPTLCEVMGLEVPRQCDGMPLDLFVQGGKPRWWREAAHWEFHWRSRAAATDWPGDRSTTRDQLAVLRSGEGAYVQFGDGSWRCFDLSTDPGWGAETVDPAVVLGYAQSMLAWRSQHADQTLTGTLIGLDL